MSEIRGINISGSLIVFDDGEDKVSVIGQCKAIADDVDDIPLLSIGILEDYLEDSDMTIEEQIAFVEELSKEIISDITERWEDP